MTTSSYTEGDLIFRFPPHWGVRKYDQQRFYRQMGGMGLKGVDFLAIDPSGEGHLYLIEVKNYRTRYREGLVFKAPLKEQEELAEIVSAKYKHTMRAIRAIHLYYQRKWWYQLFLGVFRKSLRFQYDTIFWTRAYDLARAEKHHTLLLWMETEETAGSYRQQLHLELQERLGGDAQLQIAQRAAPFPAGLQVEAAK